MTAARREKLGLSPSTGPYEQMILSGYLTRLEKEKEGQGCRSM